MLSIGCACWLHSCALRCEYCSYPLIEGRVGRVRDPEAVVDETPSPMAAAMGGSSLAMARSAARRSVPASQKPFSETDAFFLARMEVDIEERRKVAFIVRAPKEQKNTPTRAPRAA